MNLNRFGIHSLKNHYEEAGRNDFLQHLEMYQISGQPPVTEHSLERYFRDRESGNKIREEAARTESQKSIFNSQIRFKERNGLLRI
jgi:hypothetical protein